MAETQFEALISAIGSMGISMQEATEALKKLNIALMAADTYNAYKQMQQTGQNQMIIDQLNELRPALDVTTEKPNQKSDLEIFDTIEWDEKFLNFLNKPLDLDF